MSAERDVRRAAIRFIVCLGFVSLFADMTYEGAYSITGPFLKGLGATAIQVGFIAGFGEMIAASLRYFTGKFADRTRAYWSIVTSGYLLNLIAVPALAFAGTWQAAALLIVVERTGKAMRGPARDVLLSEATATVGHGWGFGLHAAMDQTGAVLGPLLMVAAVEHWKGFSMAFLPLAVPAFLALASIVLAHAYFPARGVPPKPPPPREMPDVFWRYVAAAGLLACGFVDFPLLSYHIQERAIVAPATIPLLYAGAMAVVGSSALLAGRLYDRYGIVVLAWGILISLFSLPLGFLGGTTGVIIAVACWGAGIGIQDATLRPGIAQVVSMNKRGTAFGAFNGVYGVAWFAGSVLMGWLYSRSLTLLVVFGVAAQLCAAGWFLRLRRPLRAAIEAGH